MINFWKYNSAGNDFILVDNRLEVFPKKTDFIQKLCDRNFGVGADGLILLELDDDTNYFMHYFNADGLLSSFCGNGSMCCAHFAQKLNLLSNSSAGFQGCFSTREGKFNLHVHQNQVRVSMPNVSDFSIDDGNVIIQTGSPHYVIFTSKLKNLNINKEGADIRYSKKFCKNGINVTFVEKKSDGIFIRTYERGVESETLSCGTGVVAAVLSLFICKMLPIKDEIFVHTEGGVLSVSFQYNSQLNSFSNIILSNKVNRVFGGQITMPKI
tara:strand:- start:341 stop:1144 length:804 start_codon:yes stop_codon:yes gene_type:complete